MIYLFWILICLILIFLIFFQMPKESMGLTSFINGSDFLGSPNLVDKVTKIVITITIFLYIFIAFKLNTSI